MSGNKVPLKNNGVSKSKSKAWQIVWSFHDVAKSIMINASTIVNATVNATSIGSGASFIEELYAAETAMKSVDKVAVLRAQVSQANAGMASAGNPDARSLKAEKLAIEADRAAVEPYLAKAKLYAAQAAAAAATVASLPNPSANPATTPADIAAIAKIRVATEFAIIAQHKAIRAYEQANFVLTNTPDPVSDVNTILSTLPADGDPNAAAALKLAANTAAKGTNAALSSFAATPHTSIAADDLVRLIADLPNVVKNNRILAAASGGGVTPQTRAQVADDSTNTLLERAKQQAQDLQINSAAANDGKGHAETTLVEHVRTHPDPKIKTVTLGPDKAQAMIRCFLGSLKKQGPTIGSLNIPTDNELLTLGYDPSLTPDERKKKFAEEYIGTFLPRLPSYLDNCPSGGFLSETERKQLTAAIEYIHFDRKDLSNNLSKLNIKKDELQAAIDKEKEELNASKTLSGFVAGTYTVAIDKDYEADLNAMDDTAIDLQRQHIEALNYTYLGSRGTSHLDHLNKWIANKTTSEATIEYTNADYQTTPTPLITLSAGSPEQKNLAQQINGSTFKNSVQTLTDQTEAITTLGAQIGTGTGGQARVELDELLKYFDDQHADIATSTLTDAANNIDSQIEHYKDSNGVLVTNSDTATVLDLMSKLAKAMSAGDKNAETAALQGLAHFETDPQKREKWEEKLKVKHLYSNEKTDKLIGTQALRDHSDLPFQELESRKQGKSGFFGITDKLKVDPDVVVVPLKDRRGNDKDAKQKQALALPLYHREVAIGTGSAKKTIQQTIINNNFRNNPETGKFEDDMTVKDRLRKLVMHDDLNKPCKGDGKVAAILNTGKIKGLKTLDKDEKYIVEMHGKVKVEDGKGGTKEVEVVGFKISRVKLTDKGELPVDDKGKVKSIPLSTQKDADGFSEQTIADMVARDLLFNSLDGPYNMSAVSTVITDQTKYQKAIPNTGLANVDPENMRSFNIEKARATAFLR